MIDVADMKRRICASLGLTSSGAATDEFMLNVAGIESHRDRGAHMAYLVAAKIDTALLDANDLFHRLRKSKEMSEAACSKAIAQIELACVETTRDYLLRISDLERQVSALQDKLRRAGEK